MNNSNRPDDTTPAGGDNHEDEFIEVFDDGLTPTQRATFASCKVRFNGRAVTLWISETGGEFYALDPECREFAVLRGKYFASKWLAANYDARTSARRGERMSEADALLLQVMQRHVARETPIPYHSRRRVMPPDAPGQPWKVNTNRMAALAPAEGVPGWGEGFPWIAGFLDQFFVEEDGEPGLPEWLAWLGDYYWDTLRAAEDPHYRVRKGLALVIAGGPGRGKNFIIEVIAARLLGLKATQSTFDIEAYYTGRTNFVDDTITCAPLVTLHDPVLNRATNRHMADIMKKLVANHSVRFNRKGRPDVEVNPFCARLVITCNLDGGFLRALPKMEESTADKMLVLRSSAAGEPYFNDHTPPVPSAMEEELRAFGAWLVHNHVTVTQASWPVRAGDLPPGSEPADGGRIRPRFGIEGRQDRKLICLRAEVDGDHMVMTSVFDRVMELCDGLDLTGADPNANPFGWGKMIKPRELFAAVQRGAGLEKENFRQKEFRRWMLHGAAEMERIDPGSVGFTCVEARTEHARGWVLERLDS